MSKIKIKLDSLENYEVIDTPLLRGEPALSTTFPYELRVSSGDSSWNDAGVISFIPVNEFTPTSPADLEITNGTITYDNSFLYIKVTNGWKRVPLVDSPVSETSIVGGTNNFAVPQSVNTAVPNSITNSFTLNTLDTEVELDEFNMNQYLHGPVAPDWAYRPKIDFADFYPLPRVIERDGNRYIQVENLQNIVNEQQQDLFLQFNKYSYDSGSDSWVLSRFPITEATYPHTQTSITTPLPYAGYADTDFIVVRVVIQSMTLSSFTENTYTGPIYNGDGNYRNLKLFHGGSHPFFGIYPKGNSVNLIPPYAINDVFDDDYRKQGDISWERFGSFMSHDVTKDPSQDFALLDPESDEFRFPNFYPLSTLRAAQLLGSTINSLDCGPLDTFYAVVDNSLWAWGWNLGESFGPFARLNTNETEARDHWAIPVNLGINYVTKVQAGDGWTIYLTNPPVPGLPGIRELGSMGGQDRNSVTTHTLAGAQFVDISLYNTTAAAVANNGRVYIWGFTNSSSGFDLSFGQSTDSVITEPLHIPEFDRESAAIEVSIGEDHILVLYADGVLKAYGNNGQNQLGSNATALSTNGFSTTLSVRMDTSGDQQFFAAGNTMTLYADSTGTYAVGQVTDEFPGDFTTGIARISMQKLACFASKSRNMANNTAAFFDASGEGELLVIGKNNGWSSYNDQTPIGAWSKHLASGNLGWIPETWTSSTDQSTSDIINYFRQNHPKGMASEYNPIHVLSISTDQQFHMCMNENNFLAAGHGLNVVNGDGTSYIRSNVRTENAARRFSKQERGRADALAGYSSWGIFSMMTPNSVASGINNETSTFGQLTDDA